jgi:hypothetical protein
MNSRRATAWFATVVAGVLIAATGWAGIEFHAAELFQLGGGGSGTAVGDFNRDGFLDSAVVTQGSVAIFLGDGKGHFSGPTFFPASPGAGDVAVGDFNEDGKLDLALTDDGGSSVIILLGNGLGGFSPGGVISLGANRRPSTIAAADLNGDGYRDLAVVEFYGGSIAVLLGAGNGSFSTPAHYPAGGDRPTHLAVGDFNGDGKPDIATALCGETCNSFPHGVSVLLGNGDGTFGAPALIFSLVGVTSLGVADFDGDGKLDLAALSPKAPNPDTGKAYILRGNGLGGFTQVNQFALGMNPEVLLVGDFTRDGLPDLAVINGGEGSLNIFGTLQLFAGTGTGGFTLKSETLLSHLPVRGVVGEFNRDGKLDLVVSHRGLTQQMGLYLGDGRGGFRVAPRFAAGSEPASVLAARLDRNRPLDLAVTNYSAGTVTLLAGNGRGAFAPFFSSPLPVVGNPRSAGAGDFNRDGKIDLAVVSQIPPSGSTFFSGYVTILLGDGHGAYFPAPGSPITVGEDPRDIAVADFNRDGKPDLAITLDASFYGPPIVFGGKGTKLQLLFGNGNGTFSAPVDLDLGVSTLFSVHGKTCCDSDSWPATNPRSVKAADVNGDGKVDLVVVADFSDDLIVFLGDGNGGFATLQAFTLGPLIASGYNPRSLVVADLNGDGKPDAAVSNFSTLDVALFFGDGAGGFTLQSQRYPVGDGSGITAADFSGRLRRWYEERGRRKGHEGECTEDDDDDHNNGKGHDKKKGKGHRCAPRPAALDLAVVDRTFNNLTVLVNDGTGNFAIRHFAVGNSPRGVAAGDFDRDGRPDLAVVNAYTSDVSILLNRSTR